MSLESLPTYSVKDLNQSIGTLLKRGFAPRFILNATVSKCQLKRGHMWMTLTDGVASIDAVIWSSNLSKISYRPKQEDGVLIVGSLNFWENQARISIKVIDLRASISTVLRQFEVVRSVLIKEGLINDERRRNLPKYPSCIAILTSVPSSALADMLRTAKERWPLTKLLILPIPVQGDAKIKIKSNLAYLSLNHQKLGVQAIVIARGGGSREDLMLFDNEEIGREIANFPIPVVSGIGHEDDLTIVDLVSDHRAATPTAAIVELLPSREVCLQDCYQKRQTLYNYCSWLLKNKINQLSEKRIKLIEKNPLTLIKEYRNKLSHRKELVEFSSPESWIRKGFCIIRNDAGKLVTSIQNINSKDKLNLKFNDGKVIAKVENIYTKDQI